MNKPAHASDLAAEQKFKGRACSPLTPETLAAVAEGDAQFERGEAIDLDDFAEEIRAKFAMD